MEDEMMICPYNETHVILRARMPFHLQKCKKNYHGPSMWKCPYNAMHIFKTEALLQEHIQSEECSDIKYNFNQRYEGAGGTEPTASAIRSKETKIEM